MAEESPYINRFKMSVFWKNSKGVKNPSVLYVINAGVVEDTKCSWLEFYILYPLDITYKAEVSSFMNLECHGIKMLSFFIIKKPNMGPDICIFGIIIKLIKYVFS